MRLTLALALLASMPAHAADAQSDALASAASNFYAVYMTLHPSDGVPDAAVRAKFAGVVSPDLDRLFGDAENAEAHYADATKHQSPPLIEGDIFSANFEGATSYKIGGCAPDRNGGQCAVTLRHDERDGRTLVWTDTVYLVRVGGSLRVDDIAYSGDFGNAGRLTATLKDAIRNGNAFAR